ncbi:beta-L-arabinofuranosidase domain-containing protein [Streptomyces sp. L7]
MRTARTCAAIASVQWSWRMALLTGEARYSDLIERTLYNGFLAGASLDGERWLYVNPAPGPRRPHRPGRRPVGPPHPLVPLRLLPAERHAAARFAGALPRHQRHRRRSRSTSTPAAAMRATSTAPRSRCESRPGTRGRVRSA